MDESETSTSANLHTDVANVWSAHAVNRPAGSLATALQGEAALSMKVQKISTRGHFKARVLTLPQDRLALFCTRQMPGGMGSKWGILSSTFGLGGGGGRRRRDLRQQSNQNQTRYLDVADINAVCSGYVGTRKLENTRKNRLKGLDSKVDTKCNEIVTIWFGGDQTLDILVSNTTEQRSLIQGLQDMIAKYDRAALQCSNEALLLRYIWYDVDVNRDITINDTEFLKILGRINFGVGSNAKQVYRDYCRELAIKPSIGLRLDQLLDLLQVLKKKDNTIGQSIWDQVVRSPDQTIMTVQEFHQGFLRKVQGDETTTLADVQNLFVQIKSIELDYDHTAAAMTNSEAITRAQFEAYLYHEYNQAYHPLALSATPRLTKPLSYYYINTSHNTYLMGDQLQSQSSVEMYARALRRGCKCLELDCYDGETQKGHPTALHPVVYHGHTLTSKILFADILQVVKNYIDDHKDTYPIILSLETHCSHSFQKAMAHLLTTIFGSMLYIPNKNNKSMSGPLPTPESLRGKVVIKGKRPPDPEDGGVPIIKPTTVNAPHGSESHGFSEVNDGFSHSQYDISLYDDDEEPPIEEDDKDDYDPYDEHSRRDDTSPKTGKPPVVVEALARLTLFHGTKYKSFEKSIQQPESHMHSISELKIFKVLGKAGSNASHWRHYNEKHMTRTYPSGARVDSSNYNPILPWAMGCQMVALNFQTPDSHLILNDGMFRQNSGCGYVRKPDSAQSGGRSSTNVSPKPPVYQLGIRVLGATCLPKPMGAKIGEYIDPYVEVTIHDMNGPLYTQGSFSTPSVTDNGFCPIWKNQTLSHFVVFEPTLAMIQFTLREADIALDDDVAFAAIPLQHLRTGYRSIQLYDRNNTRTGPFRAASLLVQIVKNKTITMDHNKDVVEASISSLHA